MSKETKEFNQETYKSLLREIVTIESWEKLSRKEARNMLEEKLDLPKDALKFDKESIHSIIDNIIGSIRETRKDTAVENANNQKEDSKSNTPVKQPRNLKRSQANAMSKAYFLKNATSLKTKIGNNIEFDMLPRIFGPGSCGWFYGSKVSLPVGNQNVWCQLSVNCIALGSKEWQENSKDKKRRTQG